MSDKDKIENRLNRLAVALAVLVVYNLTLTAIFSYSAYYAMDRLKSFSETDRRHDQEINQVIYRRKNRIFLLKLFP